MNEIRVFSPATVANVNCGFDVLGFALDGLGDEMVLRKVPEKGIKITKITGADLPFEPKENVVGVAGLAMLNSLDLVPQVLQVSFMASINFWKDLFQI
mgnify:CR=1 FL=1